MFNAYMHVWIRPNRADYIGILALQNMTKDASISKAAFKRFAFNNSWISQHCTLKVVQTALMFVDATQGSEDYNVIPL